MCRIVVLETTIADRCESGAVPADPRVLFLAVPSVATSAVEVCAGLVEFAAAFGCPSAALKKATIARAGTINGATGASPRACVGGLAGDDFVCDVARATVLIGLGVGADGDVRTAAAAGAGGHTVSALAMGAPAVSAFCANCSCTTVARALGTAMPFSFGEDIVNTISCICLGLIGIGGTITGCPASVIAG